MRRHLQIAGALLTLCLAGLLASPHQASMAEQHKPTPASQAELLERLARMELKIQELSAELTQARRQSDANYNDLYKRLEANHCVALPKEPEPPAIAPSPYDMHHIPNRWGL